MATLRIGLLHRATKNPKQYGTTKPAPVYISLRLKGEKDAFVNTKVNVSLSQWNKKRKMVINHAQLATLNKRIADLRYKLEIANKKLSDRGISVTPTLLKDYVFDPIDFSFSVFFRKEMEKRKRDVKIGTYKNHRQTINALDEYRSSVSFDKICDPNFILDFIDWLGVKRGLKPNSRHRHFRVIKAYINLAERRRHIKAENNPIRHLKGAVKTEKADKTYLNIEELAAFEKVIFDKKKAHLQKYLDCFLLGCYTGLRYGDLTNIRSQDIVETDKGLKLYYKAEKTKKPNVLPLYELFPSGEEGMTKPEAIVKKIMAKPSYLAGRRLFEINSVQVLNRGLKQIAKLADVRPVIKEKITSHAARRTCVNILYRKGADTQVLMAITQHSDERQLMKYLDVDAEIIETRLSRINW